MGNTEENTTDRATDLHLELLEQFASYLKLSFLYPSNNHRVVAYSAAVCDALRKLHKLTKASLVTLKLHGSDFEIDGQEVHSDSPIAEWLREAFVKTALGGLEVIPDIDGARLAEFVDRLRENFTRSDQSFEQLWGATPAGIRPIELRFRGRHSNEEEAEDAVLGAGSQSHQDEITAMLLASEELTDKLDQIRELLTKYVDMESEEFATIDLLEPIRRALPAEAQANADEMCRLADRVLTASVPRVLAVLQEGGSTQREAMELLTAEVGRQFFVRSMDDLVEVETNKLPEGKPEDEFILENLEMMLAEYEQLPSAKVQLEEDEPDHAREEAGMLLHYLATGEEMEILDGARQRLGVIFEIHPDLRTLIEPYVELALSDEPDPIHQDKSPWQVLEFAHDRGYTDQLPRRPYLDTPLVKRSFPCLFGAFLDQLKPDHAPSLLRLDDALTAIGAERMAKAASRLIERGTLTDERRLSVAVGSGHDAMVPTIEHLAPIQIEGIRKHVVAYLRRRSLPTEESTALRVVRPFSYLSAEYLNGLASWTPDMTSDGWLVEEASRIIRFYLRRTAENEELLDVRQRAAHQLRGLPSVENLLVLRELSREGGLIVFNKELRGLRRAARAAYKDMKKLLHGHRNG